MAETMEMSPLERAARAVLDTIFVVEEDSGPTIDNPEEVVRAVLQAIREPSGDMVTTAMSMHGDITGPAVELVWQAMIDRALSEWRLYLLQTRER